LVITSYRRKKFVSTFEDDSLKLSQSLFAGVVNTFAALDLLSTVMVAHASAVNDSWPLTTLPHFGNIASKALSMSAAINVWSVMLVDGVEKRREWEDYAAEHLHIHVNETLHLMETDVNYGGEIPWDIPRQFTLHDDENPVPYES
jgi:hypothetical protein